MQLMIEIPEKLARQVAPEIEHLYIHLGRAYEVNTEWEQARAVYSSLLAYARDACEPVMESAALNRLAALAAQ